jgi:hypothetical protein
MDDSKEDIIRSQISPQACNQLHQLAKDYRRAFTDFNDILEKNKLDTNLRFLIFRMDFNEYYKQDREKQRGNMDFDALNVDSYDEYDGEDSESEEEEEEQENSQDGPNF